MMNTYKVYIRIGENYRRRINGIQSMILLFLI